ncbi:MAG: outer membrane beta-barrel protein [Flavobacteriales bacterium]|nr:outer membrane beta-barrel protein [Flavobacteriales bacterium]
MKIYVLILLLFSAIISFGQDDKFNAFSLEIGYGIHAPLAPGDLTDRSNYLGFSHFKIGGRYQITQKIGVKLSYANDRFTDKENDNLGITYNRVGLEGIYNIGRHILPYYIYENVGLLAHAGIGYSRAKPVDKRSSEQTGNFTIGLRPQVKITERIALYGDGTYVMNFKQHYSYSGILLTPDYQDKTGSFATFSIGVMVYLGDMRRHADWF